MRLSIYHWLSKLVQAEAFSVSVFPTKFTELAIHHFLKKKHKSPPRHRMKPRYYDGIASANLLAQSAHTISDSVAPDQPATLLISNEQL